MAEEIMLTETHAAADARDDRPGDAHAVPRADAETLPFDQALAELQETVHRLEQGGLPLEEAIALYERGVALHERCARLLGDAELRVQRLVERGGGQVVAADAPDLQRAD
jgi:exodeoxyribonuclease VII small subunit